MFPTWKHADTSKICNQFAYKKDNATEMSIFVLKRCKMVRIHQAW